MLPAEMEADNEWRLAYASVVADPAWYGMEVGSGGGVAGGGAVSLPEEAQYAADETPLVYVPKGQGLLSLFR